MKKWVVTKKIINIEDKQFDLRISCKDKLSIKKKK